MKLKIYCYRSPEKGFSQPRFLPYSKEDMITEVKRSLIGLDKKTASQVEDLILCYLGVFDDSTGIIESTREELLPLFPYIKLKEDIGDER